MKKIIQHGNCEFIMDTQEPRIEQLSFVFFLESDCLIVLNVIVK